MGYEYTRENDLWEDVCSLQSFRVEYDDMYIARRTETIEREVFCKVGSLYNKEFHEAKRNGINGQWKLVVARVDYENETSVIYQGKRYTIYRTYIEGDYIELYVRDDAGVLDENN